MAMTRYVEERKFYGEDTADLYDYKSNPRTKTVELFRLFKESRPDLRASALEMLDKFTSAANEDSIEADTAIDYVDSPKVSQGKSFFSGRWRLISNKEFRDPTDSNVQGILQHLKLYWNTTVLAGTTPETIDWTRARVVSYESSPGNSETFDGSASASANPAKLAVIEWSAVAPEKVATVVTEFAANFSTDAFTVDGQEFPADWSYIFAAVKDDDTDLDGTKTVRFVVGRPEFVLTYQGQLLSSKAYTGYMIWDLPQSLAQTLINTVKAAHPRGISIYPDYDKVAHTCSVRLRVRDSISGGDHSFPGGASCMQTDTISLYTGYTEAALQALLSVLASSVVAGTWYDISVTEDAEDGLYDATVTKHVANLVTVGPITTEVSSAASKVTTKVYNATADLVLPSEPGSIVRGSWTKNANCTTDQVVEVETPDNQEATSYDKSAAQSTVSELNTQRGTPLSSPSRSAGEVVRTENAPTEAGKYRTVEAVTTYIDQDTTSREKSGAQTVVRALNTQKASQDNSSHSSGGDGTIVRVDNAPTESGKYRVTVETATAVNQLSTATDASMAAVSVKTINTQLTSAEVNSDVDAAERGIMYRREVVPTEFGRYRKVKETITARDQVAISTDNSPAGSATRTVHTENETDLTAPGIVTGTITRQEATPTESGNVRTAETVIVPTDQVSTDGESSGAAEVTAVHHTEASIEPTVTAHAPGFIYRLSSAPTESGQFRTAETTVAVKNQTATGGEASSAQTTVTVVNTENTTVPAATAALGTIKRVSAAPTEAGLYRTTEETATAIDQTATSGEDSLNESVVVTVNTQAAAVGAVSAASGTVKKVHAVPTEFGRYHRTETVITPKARTVLDGQVDAFQRVTETRVTQTTTAVTAPPAYAVGTKREVRNEPTDTGFKTTDAIVTATERSKSHTSAVADRYSEVTDWHRNATDLPDASAVSNASVEVRGEMNAFGLYDYVKTTRTANAPLSCPAPVSYTVNGKHYFAPVTTYPGGKVFQASYVSALIECYDVYTHTISYHLTAAAAAAAISGSDNGSGISMVGDNLWVAHKITSITNAITTLNFAAPKSTYEATRAVYDEA